MALPIAADLVDGPQVRGRLRDLRGRVSGKTSRSVERRVRSRQSQAQDRRRRHARHHAVLLRHRRVPAFSRSLRGAGIDAPIVPGILPITRFPQITRFAKRCGASIPDWLEHRFDGLEDNPETRKLISAAVAIEQVHTLQRHGVEQFHFYTLNRSELTYAICHALGVRPRARRQVMSRQCLKQPVRTRPATCASCLPNASSFSTAPWAP